MLKKVFLKILRNSQEMHCAAVSNKYFLIRFPPQWNVFMPEGLQLYQKRDSDTCFPVNFLNFFAEHLRLWETVSCRNSRPEVFLGKGVLKICSKFTGEHPCRSVISIKLQSNFVEIALWYRCSLVNLLHNFRTLFLKNASGWLLLYVLN